jgi:K+-transporting ATPase KdpF subunit
MNSTDNLVGLILAVLLTGYLIYALVFPENL